MGNSKLLLSLFPLFISFDVAVGASFNTSNSPPHKYKCSADQSHSLLLFKQSLSSINFSISNSICHGSLGSEGYYPMLMNWNTSTDCCDWDGVTCNHSTGDVISLELGCSMLRGTLHPNTSIFNLPHLQSLSLAYNDFTGSQLPSYLNITTPLKIIDLRSIGLQGRLPDNIFNLQYLEELYLSDNYDLTSPLPKGNMSTSNIPLKVLELRGLTNVSGEIFNLIGHLKDLNELDLSYTNLLGEIPNSIGHFKSLNSLHLSSCGLVGSIPKSIGNLTHLVTLSLSDNMLNGKVPFELFSLLSLKGLYLNGNQLEDHFDVVDQGPIMPTFRQLTNLTDLDLSFNNFRGKWELDTLLLSLTNLEQLRLSYSGLSIMTNSASHYVYPNLKTLHLASCKLTVFPEFLRTMRNLEELDLSDNHIHGHIPDWAGEIGGYHLIWVDLSNNSITGLTQFQWEGLEFLYLASNMIQGPFPPSICSLRHLQYLDISDNSFDGTVPQCLVNISSSLVSLNVRSNRFRGPFPPSICNMSYLELLDMSDNSFAGVIPQCVGNFSSSLAMVDLRKNNFHGTIPNVYEDCGRLEGLILNGNQLDGEVPRSLSKCKSLRVVDFGNNHLNGTFPGWLGDLPNLQAFILKSNNFHGPIIPSSTIEFPFPSLRVIDVSHNGFIGLLPRKYFQNFNAMKNVVKRSTEPEYLNTSGVYYSIIAAVKGVNRDIPKILVDYTIVDLSNNYFEGEIPDIIGNLNSLIVLNLSQNYLTGRIPHALGKLSEIESLDLSCNKLTGEIPRNLADITALSVLNLSENHLSGHIPQGKQFNTFTEDSFRGNSGLCGFPLPKQCQRPRTSQPEGDEEDEEEEKESAFSWKAVMLGYGCGTLIGLLMGYLMLSSGTPKWFNAIADAGENMILKKQNKRRYVFIRK